MTKKAFIFFIRFYQLIFSPDRGIFKFGPAVCRFYPSCPDYGVQAIEKFGVLKGGWLAAKRILKCQPFSEGGYDPVK